MTIKVLTKIPAVVLGLAIGGCSGGGDDSGSTESPSSTGVNTTTKLAGVYKGTYNENSPQRSFSIAGLISPTGEAIFFDAGGAAIFSLSLTGTDNSLSGTSNSYYTATGNSFSFAATNGNRQATLSGTFTPRVGGSGSVSDAQGQIGTFSIDFSPTTTDRGSSLSSLVGTWGASDAATGESGQIQIATDGSYTGSDSDSCTYSGKISVIDPAVNVYRLTYRETCPGQPIVDASGLMARGQSASPPQVDGLVVLLKNASAAIALALTKQ